MKDCICQGDCEAMALDFRILRSSLSAALLWSAIIAFSVIAQFSLAGAEPITLVCQQESDTYTPYGTFTFRVDYDRKIVYWLNSDGTVHLTAAAKITESEIAWETVNDNVVIFKDNRGRDNFGRMGFSGSLSRLTGQSNATLSRSDINMAFYFSGPCRLATQKF